MVSGIGWLTCEWLVVWVDVLCSTPTLCVKQPREMYQVVCGRCMCQGPVSLEMGKCISYNGGCSTAMPYNHSGGSSHVVGGNCRLCLLLLVEKGREFLLTQLSGF